MSIPQACGLTEGARTIRGTVSAPTLAVAHVRIYKVTFEKKPVNGWREIRGLIPLNIKVHCPGNTTFPQNQIWVKEYTKLDGARLAFQYRSNDMPAARHKTF